MTAADELSRLVGLLRGQGLAVGVDDIGPITTVLHHSRGWTRERRVRALRTLLGRSPAERERFDHIAPLLFEPRAPAGPEPPPLPRMPGVPDLAGMPETLPPRPRPPDEPRPRWPAIAAAVVAAAAFGLAVLALWPDPPPIVVAAPDAGVAPPPDAGAIIATYTYGPTRPVTVSEPSPLPGTLRAIAEGCGVASLLLAAWSLVALHPRRRRAAALERLAQSPGRRMVQLDVDRAALQPIDRRTVATLAHMLAAPAIAEHETTLDPLATVEATASNAGRLTLCFQREREQPPLYLVEDVSRSMERWPAHAAQLARSLEAQGQPVERRYIAGDPLALAVRPSLDGPAQPLEEARAAARIVVVSDAAHFDREAARTPRHGRALTDLIWLSPRPGELWRSGARWVNTAAHARTLGVVPGSLELPVEPEPAWRAPRARTDPDEIADGWRSALGDEAYLALASTALLDLAASWTAAQVWALISGDVIAPPWRRFERIWDLPEIALLPGGRLSVAPALRDRLIADVRRDQPEMLARVAGWIDARLATAIAAAGAGSLGATIGQVYRDRVARAAGIDPSGARIRELAAGGLASVISAHVSADERQTWRVRDPHTTMTARLRGPLLALAALGAAGFGAASAIAPDNHDVIHQVPVDAGAGDAIDDATGDAPIDAPILSEIDAAPGGDPQRGALAIQKRGCLSCHAVDERRLLGPPFKGMWRATISLAGGGTAVVDDAYVRQKLLYPSMTTHAGYPPSHPSYSGMLTDQDMEDVIAYLRAGAPPIDGGPRVQFRAVVPDHAARGATVRVVGTGFTSPAAAKQQIRSVSVGKAAARARIESDTELTVEIPAVAVPGPTVIAIGRAPTSTLTFTVDAVRPVDAGVPDAEPAIDAGISKELALDGNITISRDTTYRALRITIGDGASLRVRNGATLTIEADAITVAGKAVIDGTGEPGARGRDGADRPDRRMGDLAAFELAKKECLGQPPDGARGADGGRGARIVLRGRIRNEAGLAIRVDGGAGGAGGRGGHGSLLTLTEPRTPPRPTRADVRQAAPPPTRRETFKCPDGAPGDAGKPGPDGPIVRSLDNNVPKASAK